MNRIGTLLNEGHALVKRIGTALNSLTARRPLPELLRYGTSAARA